MLFTIIANELLNSYFIPLCPFWWVLGGMWVNQKCTLTAQNPRNEGQALMWGPKGPQEQRTWGSGESWSWALTLCSRDKPLTCPIVSQFFQGQESSRACFKSSPAGMLQELIADSWSFWDSHFWHLEVFIYILSPMLLLSIINLINNAALIYSYPPKETFIFSEP